jgi:hypothetical protein
MLPGSTAQPRRVTSEPRGYRIGSRGTSRPCHGSERVGLDTAGKLTGVAVFLVGIALLGVVFKATIDTIGAAEGAVRSGTLVLQPLWGGQVAAAEPVHARTPEAPTAERVTTATSERASGAESTAAADKPLSPMVRFALALGARMIGLFALGFLAALIATQGAHMVGAFRSSPRRELLP